MTDQTDAIRTTVTVSGMTCDHCVRSVTEELAAIPGVTQVDVDLESGAAVIESTTPIDLDAIRVAVDEAGYELSR